MFFQFVILNSVVDIGVDGDPDRARRALSTCASCARVAATPASTVLYGLYRDDSTRAPDDRWWFVHRRFSPSAVTGSELDVFGYPDLGT